METAANYGSETVYIIDRNNKTHVIYNEKDDPKEFFPRFILYFAAAFGILFSILFIIIIVKYRDKYFTSSQLYRALFLFIVLLLLSVLLCYVHSYSFVVFGIWVLYTVVIILLTCIYGMEKCCSVSGT